MGIPAAYKLGTKVVAVKDFGNIKAGDVGFVVEEDSGGNRVYVRFTSAAYDTKQFLCIGGEFGVDGFICPAKEMPTRNIAIYGSTFAVEKVVYGVPGILVDDTIHLLAGKMALIDIGFGDQQGKRRWYVDYDRFVGFVKDELPTEAEQKEALSRHIARFVNKPSSDNAFVGLIFLDEHRPTHQVLSWGSLPHKGPPPRLSFDVGIRGLTVSMARSRLSRRANTNAALALLANFKSDASLATIIGLIPDDRVEVLKAAWEAGKLDP